MKKLGILVLIVFAIIAGSTSAYAAFAPSWTLDVNQTTVGYDLILNLDDYTSWDGLVTQQFTGYAGDNPYSLTIGIDQDPVIYLDFNLSAGAADTVFHIIAASPITPINVMGYATAQYGITDRNKNGASSVGQFDGLAYRASTNLGTFTYLLDGLNADPKKSKGTDGNVDWTNIGTVNSMQAEYWFKLSAKDSASGTSTFELAPVPEPSSIAALAGMLGSLFCVYSKRRK